MTKPNIITYAKSYENITDVKVNGKYVFSVVETEAGFHCPVTNKFYPSLEEAVDAGV